MPNAQTTQTITELGQAKLATLRASLRLLVKGYDADDVVAVLAEVLDDQAMLSYDFERSSQMRLAAKFLEGFDSFVDNYDPTPE